MTASPTPQERTKQCGTTKTYAKRHEVAAPFEAVCGRELVFVGPAEDFGVMPRCKRCQIVRESHEAILLGRKA